MNLRRGQHALLNDEENIIDVNIADEREEIDLQSPHIALQSGASHRHHPPPTGHKSSHNTTASTSSASAGGYTTISPSLSPMPPSSSNTTNVVLANTSSDTNDTYTGSRTTINDNNNSSNRQRSGQTFYLRHSNESLIFSLDQDEEDHRVGLNVRTIISAVLLCVGGLVRCYLSSSSHFLLFAFNTINID